MAYLRLILSQITLFMTMESYSQVFDIQPVPHEEIIRMREKGVISDEAPVQPDRLRMVIVTYIDFEGSIKQGQIIVLDAVAQAVVSIFRELFVRKFPLARVELITHYQGNDDLSMAANNTSSFNYRPVAGTSRLSLHSFGTAIDINPVQNPYILINEKTAVATYLPHASISFANRNIERLGKQRQMGFAEEVIDVFAQHGFYGWGGFWDTPIDYQHFQLDRDVSYLLARMNASQAFTFFNLLKDYYNRTEELPEPLIMQAINGKQMVDAFEKNENAFLELVQKLLQ